MIKKNCPESGLTLVEALIALAVFAIFALLINSIFFNILRGSTKQEALKEIKQSGDFALNQMEESIRSAKSIVTPYDCVAGDNDFSYIDKDGNTISIYPSTETGSDGIVIYRIYKDSGGNPAALTSDKVSIESMTSLKFTCDLSGERPLITIEFPLSHRNNVAQPDRPEYHASLDFQTRVYMRGSNI